MTVRIRKAQGATEYAIFIAAVLAGLLALQVYYQRAVKGNVKSRADSIGEQLNTGSEAYYNRETRSVAGRISDTNRGGATGRWTNSVVSDSSQINASFVNGYRGVTNSGNSVFASGANAWTSGEISSSEYVNETSSTHGLGTHSVNVIGNITESRSVWQDSGLD